MKEEERTARRRRRKRNATVARFVVVARCVGRKMTLKVYRQRCRWSASRRKKIMKKMHAK